MSAFKDADWTASWKRTTASERRWPMLREELRLEAHLWLTALRTPREVQAIELNGMIGSIAHLAYHLGRNPPSRPHAARTRRRRGLRSPAR